jgi:FAD/FMN-containing dehydrogenase
MEKQKEITVIAEQVLANGRVRLDESTIAALRDQVRGEVITPSDIRYEDARRVWNGLIDKRPAVIFHCTGVADVIAAVGFAREQDLPVAIRGGGHNVAGTAVCDDGVVIDLSPMKGIRVDPEARTVRAEPGLNWGELDRETQEFGLATPGGEVAMTGIAGLTLGGGMGHLRRKYGLSSDNLISVDIVTADGQFLTASEHEHPELFWGIRGGGRSLGVVTSFEFKLHPVGPSIYLAYIAYPMEQAEDVLRGWCAFADTAPDEATSIAVLRSVPAIPDLPVEWHGRPIVVLFAMYAGSVAEGERVLRPLRELGEPMFDASAETTYLTAQSLVDPLFPDGQLYYWKSVYLNDMDDTSTAAMIAHAESRPSDLSFVAIRHLGGAISQVPEEATAYGNRSAQYLASFDACWTDPTATAANIDWTRSAWGEVSRLSGGGTYVNFAGLGEEGQTLVRSMHGRNYERLAALARQYDPSGLFQSPLNVASSRKEFS